MNWGKRILMLTGLLGVFASGMVGCSKGSSSNNGVFGNASLNGLTATASDPSMPTVSLNVTSSPYQYSAGVVMLTINGQQVQIQVGTPSSYNYYVLSQGSSYGYYASSNMIGTAICMDQINYYNTVATNCQTTAIIIEAQSMQYSSGFSTSIPALQMGLLRYADGTFHSVVEKVGYPMTSAGAAGAPALSTATDLANYMLTNHN